MRYVRLSILRARGERMPINMKARLRAAETAAVSASARADSLSAVVDEVRATTAAVKTPNGTTRKIARIVEAVA